MHDSHEIIGYYEFLGAAIRCAMQDYSSNVDRIGELRKEHARLKSLPRTEKTIQKIGQLGKTIHDFETAEHYLFNPDWLEEFLYKTGLNAHLNIGYIRKIASSKMKDDKYERNFLVRSYGRHDPKEDEL